MSFLFSLGSVCGALRKRMDVGVCVSVCVSQTKLHPTFPATNPQKPSNQTASCPQPDQPTKHSLNQSPQQPGSQYKQQPTKPTFTQPTHQSTPSNQAANRPSKQSHSQLTPRQTDNNKPHKHPKPVNKPTFPQPIPEPTTSQTAQKRHTNTKPANQQTH